MNLNNWFDKGISTESYISSLKEQREDFDTVYEHFKVPENDLAALKETSTSRVIALAEVWCGHCMMNVPVLLNMLEAVDIPVSFLPRDEHLELMDRYTTNGKRFIPIFIFIDEAGNELGKWGPMAPEVEKLSNQLKAEIPPKDDPNYKEGFRKYATTISELFTKDDTYWVPTYQSIKKAMP